MVCTVCGDPVQGAETSCRTCGAPLSASVTLPAGATLNLGQYEVLKVLGQGGFGVTYQARDKRLGHQVAIKELFISGSSRRENTVFAPSTLGTQGFAETKMRFLEEARVLASFNHPGIVRVLNFFEDHGTAYLVMELLDGETLGALLASRGPQEAAAVGRVAASLAETLAEVHRAGLLHRDIKPDNIVLEKSGRVVLIDFGSVRAFAPGKTVSHTRLVTPGYAPLEQYGTAAKFGAYTDIYALGATLHHALTGVMPPPATDRALGTPLPPLPASTPPVLRRVVEAAMAVKVTDRPQSAAELLVLLRGGAPQPAPKPAPTPKPQPKPVPKPPAPPADPLADYLRARHLTEQQLRDLLYDGDLSPGTLPNPVRQALVGRRWLDSAGEVPGPLRRWETPTPKAAPAPVHRPALAALRWTGVVLGILGGVAAALVGEGGPSIALLGGVLGALGGYLLSNLVWWTLPALPAVAGVFAYLYGEDAALPPVYLVGLPLLAALISFGVLRAVRRL
ncbi:protein kinase [Deinococcus radiopugnans]|uniref:Serine/threonine protein kinase n=1 Tax=Deinococcus radiopugnans ATCC 19172 TaxID=585398 RepID=A0A5C4Y7S6_9DEIO|nr:serine/threonine-protein kinase [Deinococcus radiopugnans]MBB6017415.1 serine/threonine protein kinase [Deinococcus radiopugnans ATCC 19172]TNM71952.1 serine/threonine protein kinase [Deinococcus radiopugnans ATCC 19172]